MAKAKAKDIQGVQLAPVDVYEERPTDDTDPASWAAAEQVTRTKTDQLPNYHKDNPKTDTSGPEHDPEVRATLLTALREEQAQSFMKTQEPAVVSE